MSRIQRRPAARLGREQRVSDILRAAREVYCEKGYESAAVAEIAARIGVVEGTVYKYFESKRELLLKVLEHWYEELFGGYERDLVGVTGTRQRLRLLIWRHLRTLREHPQLCRLMFREVRAEQDYHGSSVHAKNRRYTHYLVEVLAEGVAAGEFRRDVPLPLLRDMVYGGIEHHAWSYLSGRGSLDIERTADLIVGIVCEGIATTNPASLKSEAQRLSRIADRMERSLARNAR